MRKACLLCILMICLGIKITGREIFPKKNRKGLKLDYSVSLDLKNNKYFSIKAVISGIQTESLYLRMTSNYGRIEKLNDLIPQITISSKGKKIFSIKKINEFLWKIPLNTSKVEAHYLINTQFPYSSLNMVRLPYRDDQHLYFPAASVFIHPDDEYLNENNIVIDKIRINFELPPGWIAATSWGADTLTYELDPPSLDILLAGLIGVGSYSVDSFVVNGLPVVTAVLSQEGNHRNAELIQVIEYGLKSAYSIFHFFPMSRFFAMIHFIYQQPGQLNGNALGWSINLNAGRHPDHYQRLEMVSHIFAEIFHHWNGNNVLNRGENKSLVWFTEGVTNYYRLKNMLTSGLIREEEFFRLLSEEFNKVFHSSRQEDRLDELSQDYYMDREAMTLTYSKGCCATFALDLLIEKISSGQKSFDDVMKLMIKRYNYKENGHVYTHEEVDHTIKEILGEKYFSSYKKLYGKEFIPEFKSILEKTGLYIQKKKGRKLYFGIISYGPPSDLVSVDRIDRESPAYAAGLRTGDIILEINKQKIKSPASIKEIIRDLPENYPAELTLRRNDQNFKIRTSWNSYKTEFLIKRKKLN